MKDVRKSFGKNVILEDVNLVIEEGDILGVIGQSGSGKSTLLNLLTGFMEPTEGEITYYSSAVKGPRNLNDEIHHLKKEIGFTPQHNSFYPQLTVEENLIHFGKLYGVNSSTLMNNLNNLLQITKLADHRHKLALHLSGGMQKRLDISCSLIHKPKVLVLDEPTADLDPLLQEEILNLLQSVNKQGVTIVIASHHLDSIENICNKVAIVHKGKIHSAGSLEDVRKPFFRDHFTISISSGQNKDQIIAKLRKMPVQRIVDQGNKILIYPTQTEKTIAALLTIIKEENLYLHDLDLRHPSLNEVFQKIAQEK